MAYVSFLFIIKCKRTRFQLQFIEEQKTEMMKVIEWSRRRERHKERENDSRAKQTCRSQIFVGVSDWSW